MVPGINGNGEHTGSGDWSRCSIDDLGGYHAHRIEKRQSVMDILQNDQASLLLSP